MFAGNFQFLTPLPPCPPCLLPPVSRYWEKLRRGDFRISGQSLIKRNCHNSRTSDDIDMKLGLVTKLDKRDKTISKKLMMASCRKIVTSLTFLQFTANLEQSEAGLRTHNL